MKLFFYSDHVIPPNRKIDERLLGCIGKKNPTVVWIPAGNRPERIGSFFTNRKEAYSKLGIASVSMISIHESCSPQDVDRILDCDILHLSGGDPYVFATNLKIHGLFDVLQRRAKSGGTIVGDSAGAMIMTPSIKICDFGKSSSPPKNFDHKTAGLVDFEVHPHWGSYGATKDQIKDYSAQKELTIYCIPDGSGVALIDSKVEFVGPVLEVKNGRANQAAHTTPVSAPR